MASTWRVLKFACWGSLPAIEPMIAYAMGGPNARIAPRTCRNRMYGNSSGNMRTSAAASGEAADAEDTAAAYSRDAPPDIPRARHSDEDGVDHVAGPLALEQLGLDEQGFGRIPSFSMTRIDPVFRESASATMRWSPSSVLEPDPQQLRGALGGQAPTLEVGVEAPADLPLQAEGAPREAEHQLADHPAGLRFHRREQDRVALGLDARLPDTPL